MNTSEPTRFPTEYPSFYNLTYPELTSNGSIIPGNFTYEQSSDQVGYQILWIVLGTIGAGLTALGGCLGSILLHNKCLDDFKNFKQVGKPNWL